MVPEIRVTVVTHVGSVAETAGSGLLGNIVVGVGKAEAPPPCGIGKGKGGMPMPDVASADGAEGCDEPEGFPSGETEGISDGGPNGLSGADPVGIGKGNGGMLPGGP